MSSIVGQDWKTKTLCELFVQWQAFQMDRWMHSATIRSAFAMTKVNPVDLNPYLARGDQTSPEQIPIKRGPVIPVPSE